MDKSHKRSRKFRDSSERNLRGQEKFSGSSGNAPNERRRDDRLRQNSKDWKYSYRDKSSAGGWTKLLNRFETKCKEEKIGHVLDPVRLADIKSIPLRPTMEAYQIQYDLNGDPIPEHPADREERMLRNKQSYDDWAAVKAAKSKKLDKLPEDFDKAITVMYSCLDDVIVDALDVEKKKHPGADPEELYGILRQELETAHGPHTSLDAVRLKQNLRDLRGDYISWRHYLSEFRAGVSLLANTPIRDKDGNVVRGPVPPVVHPPTPAIGANGRQRRLWLDEVRKADQDHADQWADGGPILMHTVPERELIEYAMAALAESQLDSFVILHKELVRRIDSIPDSEHILKEIEAICKRAGKDNGIKIKLHHKPERSYGRDRRRDDHRGGSGRYRESGRPNEPYSSNQYRMQVQPKCKNCGGAHVTPKCRDSKCHECGKVLKSPEERQQHWFDTHRQGNRARSSSPKGARGTDGTFSSGKDGNFRKLRGKQRSSKRSRDEARSDHSDYGSSEDGSSRGESSRSGRGESESGGDYSVGTGAGDSYSEDDCTDT